MRKVIKVFTVVYTCILIIVISCCPAFATAGTGYVFTEEDYYDLGLIKNERGDFVSPPDYGLPAFFATTTSTPYYPSFKPSQLPWADMPDFILDIARSSLTQFTDLDYYLSNNYLVNDLFRIPFVLVRNTGKVVTVWVGYNLSLGIAEGNSYVRIYGIGPQNTLSYAIRPSICYSADYSYDSNSSEYFLSSPWQKRPGSDFYNAGQITYFSGVLSSGNSDIYCSGANAVFFDKDRTTGDIYLPSWIRFSLEDSNHHIQFAQDLSGFSSGVFLPPSYDITFPFYITDFKVPTESDIENEKLDGIQDSLSEQNDILTQTGQYSDVDPSAKDELENAESDLFTSNYNPDNFLNDFTVDLDGSAINAVFAIIDSFLQIDSTVFGAVLMVLTLGVIALIFGR